MAYRKKNHRPKWTIYKHELDKNKKCLSVDNFGILLSLDYRVPAAFAGLCKGLKYLPKIQYFILDYPNVTEFSIFKTVFWADQQHWPMSENNITKMNSICVWWHIFSPNFHRMRV